MRSIVNDIDDKYSIYIEKGIRVSPSKVSGIGTFNVQANTQYLSEKGNQTKDKLYKAGFDSVEHKNEENESEDYQVLVILSIVNDQNQFTLANLFLICKYNQNPYCHTPTNHYNL